MEHTVEILDDTVAVAARAAELIADAARADESTFEIALSGGSTPKLLYRMLSAEPWQDLVPWGRVLWFFGDERFVPSDDEQSNFRMARENLFDPAKVDPARIFRVRTELGQPVEVAADYDKQLTEHVPAGTDDVPQFDIVLLGMGADGHTASLFPGTEALNERTRFVAANHVEKLDAWRITITAPVILAARHVIMLVTGKEKAAFLKEILEGDEDENRLPSQILRQRTGPTTWLIDEAAASQL